jgi:hypothetical protein
MPFSNGRQLRLRVLFGDLTQKGINESQWLRDRDVDRDRVIGTFVDGGNSGSVNPPNLGGDPEFLLAIPPNSADSYFLRIIRDDQQVTVQQSSDGNLYTNVVQREFDTPLGSLQTLLLTGNAFNGPGGADYDYISVSAELPANLLFYSTGGFNSPGRETQHVRRANVDGTNDVAILTNSMNSNGYVGGIDIDPLNRYLYGVTRNTVFRANLDGSNRTNLVASPGPLSADIELDLVNDRIYWSAGNSVWRSNLDGSSPEMLPLGAFGTTEGIALDLSGGKIYLTQAGQIAVANLDGTDAATFVTLAAGSQPFDIELDPLNNMLYWNEYAFGSFANQAIRRTTAGSAGPVETIFQPANSAQGLANGMDFDPVDNVLYFASGGAASNGLSRINPDGSNYQLVLTNSDGINYVSAAHPIPLHTPGSINFADADADDHAFFAGERSGSGGIPAPPVTIMLAELDLLNGSSFTLDPNEILDLGDGTLFIGQGAVFSGNGIIRGNVINAGLLRIPIVRVPTLPPITGGHVQIELAEPTSGRFLIDFSGGGGFGGGGGSLLSFEFTDDPAPIVIQGDPAPNEGTIRFDASLEITGSYEQRDTGALRLFIAGDDLPGENYSQLIVGEEVTLAGAIELVFDAELFATFGYTPMVGDTFDIVVADRGITISDDGLMLRNFVTESGSHRLTADDLTFSSYNSGIAADPDRLLQINETVFRLDLVENDTILRATLIRSIIPEPSSLVLVAICCVFGCFRHATVHCRA